MRKRMLVLAAVVVGGLWGGAAVAGPTSGMLSNTCDGCHGPGGVSPGPYMPSIAGMPYNFLKQMMTEFMKDERPSTIMSRIAKGYSDGEIDEIAKHFAGLKWGVNNGASVKGKSVDPDKAEKGKSLARECEKCHEDGGKKQDEDTPRMAGQWLDYLQLKLGEYKNDEKYPQPKKMKTQIDKLSVEDLEAVAHYFAGQK
ncbi:MAG: cytochrome c, class I [Magnetococcales bacterium]|nr:cytochrome c, class I [Magnetococcales bacterium]MBF0322306.1 cytochrome c, class I [Magnetococcales bacterium]